MAVRYDPLLAGQIAEELRERHAGRRTRELRLDRDRRLATLRFRDPPSLLFLLHPEAGHVVETDRVAGETRLDLRGQRFDGVEVPPDERLVYLALPPDGPEGTPHRLAIELHTNQWNLLLLRREADDPGGPEATDDVGGGGANGAGPGDVAPGWRVRAALWPREAGGRVLRGGAPYRPPAGERRWRERLPSLGEWRALLEQVGPADRRGAALREVAYLSSVNVGWVLGAAAAGAEADDAEDPDDEDPVEGAYRRYRSLREGAPEAWLLERDRGLQPYVRSLDEPAAERLPSLLAGMARSLAATEGWAGVVGAAAEAETAAAPPELGELRGALESRGARLRRRIDALERELEEGPAPETLREAGNLILARLGSIQRGQKTAVVEGFDGESRELELDPSLSPTDNAERYYDEAGRRERALRKIPEEVADTREELDRLEAALENLEGETELPEEEALEALWRLAGGRPREDAAGEPEERLPYRRLLSSSGLEIRVGKGARSNEELTFHHSHTEDVWLHARQVPGAHVILRWGKTDANPPRRDLLEAAVVAAVHSDARHSGTVGVDWTRRKYVRSPRKSPPGVVIPRNVQTVFVEPDEAIVKRLERNRAG